MASKLELLPGKSGNIKGAPFVSKGDGQIHSGNNRGGVSSYSYETRMRRVG